MKRRNLFSSLVGLLVVSAPVAARRTVDNTRCPNCGREGRELGILGCTPIDEKGRVELDNDQIYLDWLLKECRPCKVKWTVYTPKLKRREPLF